MIATEELREKLKPLTAEEKNYEHKMNRLAVLALGEDWQNYWPEHLERTRPIGYISEHGPYGTLELLISETNERVTGKEAVCFVENVTLPWAIRLGAAWDIDPDFFISHVRPLTKGEAERTLERSRVPNAKGGLASRREESWATVRGYIDWGKPKRKLKDSDLHDTTKRQHAWSIYNTCQSHTNLSFYRVSEDLHVVLIDKVPDYQPEFVLEPPTWFPNQTVVRLATLSCPGHITIPQLGHTRLTAVLPFWNLFNDTTDRQILLRCLKDNDIDEFLYKGCLFWCEREVWHVDLDIEVINDEQATGDAATTNEKLPNLQKVSTRLKSCIVENRALEDRLRRAAAINAASYPDWTEFEKLAVRFSELDNSVVQCFYRQMTTLTATSAQENLRQSTATKEQAQATYDQARIMTTLSWLAMVYIPLTLVTGIFGMNVKEINHQSPLSWTFPAGVASVLLLITLAVAQICYCFRKRKTSGWGGAIRELADGCKRWWRRFVKDKDVRRVDRVGTPGADKSEAAGSYV